MNKLQEIVLVIIRYLRGDKVEHFWGKCCRIPVRTVRRAIDAAKRAGERIKRSLIDRAYRQYRHLENAGRHEMNKLVNAANHYKNSLVNSICQRKIDIDKILQKDLSGQCPPGKIYNKQHVKTYLEELNSEQKKKDNETRIAKYPILKDYLEEKKYGY